MGSPAKDAIRRVSLARRGKLTPAEREERAARIAGRVLGLHAFDNASAVLAYVSMRSEVPTHAILGGVLDAGKTLLLPYVSDDGTMRATPVRSLADLEPGFRGIPEPRTRFPVDATTADLIVVPGVAFDAAGNRLGYGGGFFDAYLANVPHAFRAGICFEVQVADAIPSEPHDEPMDAVVTEERVVETAARTPS